MTKTNFFINTLYLLFISFLILVCYQLDTEKSILEAGLLILSLYFICKNRSLTLIIIALTILLKIAYGFYFNVQPAWDFAEYWSDALNKFNITLLATKSPLTSLYYGVLAHYITQELWIIYVSNALLSIYQIYLVYKISFTINNNKQLSQLACLLFSCFPSLIYFSSAASSEPTFLIFELLSFYFILKIYYDYSSNCRKIYKYIILCGISLGLMHLSRNLGLIFLACFTLVLWFVVKDSFRRKTLLSLLLSASFLLTLLPFIVFNYINHKAFSINSNPYGTLSFLYGTNKKANGLWNFEDAAIAPKYIANRFSNSQEAQLVEKEIKHTILARIQESPIDFIKFALSKKIAVMWGNDLYGYAQTVQYSKDQLHPNLKVDDRINKYRTALIKIANGYYSIIIISTILGIMIGYFSFRQTGLILLLPLLSLILLHIVLEVYSRYHVPFLPIFCIYAALALYKLLSFIEHYLKNKLRL